MFNITKEESFHLIVMNPKTAKAQPQTTAQAVTGPIIQMPPPPATAELPDDLQSIFGGKGWAPANPVELLNFEGLKFNLIGESTDLVDTLGDIGREIEKEEQLELEQSQQ
jgi:hypothetical protein